MRGWHGVDADVMNFLGPSKRGGHPFGSFPLSFFFFDSDGGK
jgi:hypothetical protein